MALSLTAVFIPYANMKAEYVKSVLIQKKPEPLSITPDRVWLRVDQSHLLQIDSIQKEGTRLRGLHQYIMGQPFHLSEIMEAEGATFSQGQWMMEGVVHRQLGDLDHMGVVEEPRKILSLPLTPKDFENWLAQAPEHMTLYQLHDYVERVRKDGHNPHRLLTNYWSRIAFSVVPLIMTLLGISISLRGSGVRAVGVAKGLGQTLGIGFLFWTAHSVGVVLGNNGALLPVIGSWIASVMFFMVGVNLFLKLR